MQTRTRMWLGGLVALLVAGAALALQPAQADSTVKVTPVNKQGWVGPDGLGNPPVPNAITAPADADGGPDSWRFGPITSPAPSGFGVGAQKFEIQPPEVNFPVADFGSMTYDFQVITPAVSGNSFKHFYANVYVDSASNGIGVFGAPTNPGGFYDCRYSFVPTAGGTGWTTFGFDGATAPTAVAGGGPAGPKFATCPATIDGNTGGVVEFLRLSGGDTSTSDNNLEGAFDLVQVEVGGDTTTYDFTNDADGDGIPDTAPPTNKDQCKKNGWQTFNNPSFRNQGQCVSYVNHNT